MVECWCCCREGIWVEPFRVMAAGDPTPWAPPPRGTRGGVHIGPIRLCTWNSQGLFAARLGRAKAKLRRLRRLMEASDVVLVQEAHCCHGYAAGFDE